ncbi:MAG: hypothetical protein QM533_07905 [Cytophagales bacterium]|nr:hypothetical protein [Cytophagales bacterium]
MTIRLQLLLLGLSVLGYLGARWWWLERKLKNAQSTQADGSETISAMPSERIEPTMTDLQGLPEDVPADALPVLPTVPSTAADRRPVLHPKIDCIAMLDMDEPCLGDLALSLLPATRRIGSKTWLVEGWNLATEAWEPVVSRSMYRYFQAGIQLVNRHGALNDVEFSEFVAKASSVADGLGASTEFPEMLAEVARAEALAAFTRAHDIQLALHLHAKRAAWSISYLQQHARVAGFVAGALPGRWVLGDSRQDMIALTIETRLALAEESDAVPIRQITLTLDVPHMARVDEANQKPFDVMCDLAIKLCASMEAAIVDEQGRAVDVQALQRTTQELEAVYDRLDGADLPAGAPLTRRLFS